MLFGRGITTVWSESIKQQQHLKHWKPSENEWKVRAAYLCVRVHEPV